MSIPSSGNPFADDNPYAPPQVATAATTASDRPVAAWRQGKILVLHVDYALPAACVKTNQAVVDTRRQTLRWLHPLVYVTLFLSPLIFIILALILRRQAVVLIPVSESFLALRRRRLILGWCAVAANIGFLLVGSYLATEPNWEGSGLLLLMVGLVGLLLSFLWLAWAERIFTAAKIELPYVWARGACQEYLDRLPPWPYV